MNKKFKIENIISNNDIVKVISSVLEVKKSGNGFFAKCPFHTEKTASFYISKNKQRYYCFGCHKTGNIINFIMEYKGYDFISAIKLISKDEIKVEIKEKTNNIFNLFNFLNKKLLENFNNPINGFVKSRKIDEKTALKFKLGLIPLNIASLKDEYIKNFLVKIGVLNKINFSLNKIFLNRLIIPIRNINGDYIGIGGRTIFENFKPKYINSPESEIFSKKKSLYGIYESKNNFTDMIIVEGYLDVIKLHQYGITNVVAILGTAFTKDHLIILRSFCKNLIFCFDGDRAGQLASIKAAFMCLPSLFDFKSINFVIMPLGYDPDSYIKYNNKQNFIKLLKKSIFILDFIFLSMNIKPNEFNFFLKLNRLLTNVKDLFIKNFITNYLFNFFYFKLSRFSKDSEIKSIFIKACIFILKNKNLIYKVDLKKFIYNKFLFFNKEIRTFIDLFFLIKNNFKLKFKELNIRLIRKIKFKCPNIIKLVNKMPSDMLENEFLSILGKIESYNIR